MNMSKSKIISESFNLYVALRQDIEGTQALGEAYPDLDTVSSTLRGCKRKVWEEDGKFPLIAQHSPVCRIATLTCQETEGNL